MNTTCPAVGRNLTRTARFVGCAVFAFLLSGTLDGQIWTPGTTTTLADSYAMNPQNPLIRIRQRLPVGDTMNALFTSNGIVITNADGSIPGYSGTVGEGTAGISFAISGIVNGKKVTDIYQKHTDPALRSGILQLAALTPAPLGDGGLPGLGGWLQDNGFSRTSMFQVPDFMSSGTELYYAVDAAEWLDGGFAVPFDLPDLSFDIVNGMSSALPGVLFSTSPFMIGSGGWAPTGDLYSGEVWIDSYHEMTTSPVPEPSTLGAGALLVGGLSLLIRRRRRRDRT